jgi:uncharacterized protein (TIGR02145 family)
MGEKIYRVLSRGVVLDKSTGLTWTRCPLALDNKPIYDFNCKGEKKIYTWNEAKDVCSKLVHEGRSDWRLPTIRELQSIVYYHHKPTEVSDFSQAVERVFPNAVTLEDINKDYLNFFGTDAYCFFETCYQHYWSSTTLEGFSDLIWGVNFFTGVIQWDSEYYKDFGGTVHYDKPKKKAVRCVAGP